MERRDKDVDSGIDRLQASLADLAGRDLDELCDAVLAWMLPPRADDAVALIAVRLHRQNRPAQPEPARAGPNRVPPNVPTGTESAAWLRAAAGRALPRARIQLPVQQHGLHEHELERTTTRTPPV